jgi:methionyl-tRNA formyltransferase
MKFVVVGSVSSTRLTLETLLRNGVNVSGVLGLDPAHSKNVSGYANMGEIAKAYGIPHFHFKHINSPEVLKMLHEWRPDYLFVVGLSQLASSEVIRSASRLCIGFHPTLLPYGRGRAPIAWILLDGVPGAATLFRMTEDADAGEILAQVPYDVSNLHYAGDVLANIEAALGAALDQVIPKLLQGEPQLRKQDHAKASWYGKRTPRDGCINWHRSAEDIHALVRASSRPHPGAYTFWKDWKIIIWRASLEQSMPFKGVVGRILTLSMSGEPIVQTGNGLLRVEQFEFEGRAGLPKPTLTVGDSLGFSTENELFELRRRVAFLEDLIKKMTP